MRQQAAHVLVVCTMLLLPVTLHRCDADRWEPLFLGRADDYLGSSLGSAAG